MIKNYWQLEWFLFRATQTATTSTRSSWTASRRRESSSQRSGPSATRQQTFGNKFFFELKYFFIFSVNRIKFKGKHVKKHKIGIVEYLNNLRRKKWGQTLYKIQKQMPVFKTFCWLSSKTQLNRVKQSLCCQRWQFYFLDI